MLAHSVRFCNFLYTLLLDTWWRLRFRSQYLIKSKQLLNQQKNITIIIITLSWAFLLFDTLF